MRMSTFHLGSWTVLIVKIKKDKDSFLSYRVSTFPPPEHLCHFLTAGGSPNQALHRGWPARARLGAAEVRDGPDPFGLLPGKPQFV